MYLPYEIPNARVLISVKTYPLPSNKYNELVCTAGFLSDGKWIRIYPIPFRDMPYAQQYNKYHWITLDLVRNARKDFRPESYRPKNGLEAIKIEGKIGTNDSWESRKKYALKEVFTSMDEIIHLAKGEESKSLATLKPKEILDFVIEEQQEREWKEQWLNQLRQYNLFDLDEKGAGKERKVLPKLPYKYYYQFLSKGDKKPRKLMIEDWELGALYWKMFRKTGSEHEANQKVKRKFLDEFCNQKDLYFFLGTTLQYHKIALNPFIIVGLFYPPKATKSNEFSKTTPSYVLDSQTLNQCSLFDEYP